MPVPLAGRSIVAWLDRVGARRNDDSRRRAMIDDCLVCRFSIIGTVGCELSDRTANLVQEWRNLRDIASILMGLSGISCTGVHNGYEGDHPWHDGKSLSSRTAF